MMALLKNFLVISIHLVLLFSSAHLNVIPKNNTVQMNIKELLDWEPPEDIKNLLPYYHSGYDYDGNPVLVIEWGNQELFQRILDKGGETLKNAKTFFSQFEARVQTGFFQESASNETGNSKRAEEVAVILDYDGLKLGHFSSLTAMKFMLERSASMEKVYHQIAYGFIINANPLVDQILNLSKPLFEKFLEKVEIYGTNSRRWIPAILKRIPRSQLPLVYGGYPKFHPVASYG